jgi:hypothetical protein
MLLCKKASNEAFLFLSSAICNDIITQHILLIVKINRSYAYRHSHVKRYL